MERGRVLMWFLKASYVLGNVLSACHMLSPLNPISKVRAGTKEGRGTKEARRRLLGCWERLPGRGKLEREVSLRMVGLGGRGFLAECKCSGLDH